MICTYKINKKKKEEENPAKIDKNTPKKKPKPTHTKKTKTKPNHKTSPESVSCGSDSLLNSTLNQDIPVP